MLVAMYECNVCHATIEGQSFPDASSESPEVAIASALEIMAIMDEGPIFISPAGAKTILRCCGNHVGIAHLVGFKMDKKGF